MSVAMLFRTGFIALGTADSSHSTEYGLNAGDRNLVCSAKREIRSYQKSQKTRDTLTLALAQKHD